MHASLLAQILCQLQMGRYGECIQFLRGWLSQAKPGEVNSLLKTCRPPDLPKVASLLRDLLSNYPRTILGTPLVMYYQPPMDFDSIDEMIGDVTGFNLPAPSLDIKPPSKDLEFIGWAPINAQLPLVFSMTGETPFVPVRKIFTAVALFRSHPLFDITEHRDALETFPGQWWGNVFEKIPGHLRLTARLLAPYPDAIEAAIVQHNAASANSTSVSCYFATAALQELAEITGELFRMDCVKAYPHSPWD